MLSSHDPLPFIHLIVSHNQASEQVKCVKSAIDFTSCTIHVQTNYSYSFWRHYSSEYEYTIRTTIRHRSEYEANIRYIPTPVTMERLLKWELKVVDGRTTNFIQWRVEHQLFIQLIDYLTQQLMGVLYTTLL